MKILKPYKGFSNSDVSQGFHEGHKAIDCVPRALAYGKPLVAPERVRIDEIRTPGMLEANNNGLINGYGIWMYGIDSGNHYQYWHCLPVFPVWGGDIVEKGQIVAYMGNAGNVSVDGAYVPLEVRDQEPHLGTHLHESIHVNGVPIDPLTVIDLVTEPDYSTFDALSAAGKCLIKISKLLSK